MNMPLALLEIDFTNCVSGMLSFHETKGVTCTASILKYINMLYIHRIKCLNKES